MGVQQMTLQLIKVTTEKAAALHSLSDEGLVTFNISHLSLQQGPKNIPVEIFIQKKDGGEFLLATLENPICRQFSCNLSVADSDEVTVTVKCSKGTATVNVIGFSEPEMIEDDYDMMHEDLSLSHDSDDTNDIAIGHQSKKKRPFDESITKPEKKNKKSKKVIEKNPSSDSSISDDDDDEEDVGISSVSSSSDNEDNKSQFIDKEAMEEENISPEDISSSSEVSDENEQLNNMVGQDIDLEKTSSGSEDSDSDDDDVDDMISNSQDNSSSNEEVENSKNKQISPPSSSSDESSSDEEDMGGVSPENLESLLSKLDKEDDNSSEDDDMDDDDDETDDDETDTDLSEIAVDKNIRKVDSESDDSEDDDDSKDSDSEKIMADDADESSDSSSSTSEENNVPPPPPVKQSNKKASNKKDDAAADNNTPMNNYIKSITDYLKKNGKSPRTKIGQAVKRPANLDKTKKLGIILNSHPELFKCTGEFVELLKK